MTTIVLPKKEYETLLDKALRYDFLRQTMASNVFQAPPTRNKKEIISAFKQTGLYNQAFLKSLKKGLSRSSYFKK
jgi:hypothetical protein